MSLAMMRKALICRVVQMYTNTIQRSKTVIRFVTTEYEFSHGRKPRGRGCWAFEARRGVDGVQRAHSESKTWRVFAPGQQSYGEAKAWVPAHVRAELPEATSLVVSVCP